MIVIITRPLSQALATQRLLEAKRLSASCYPMLDIISLDYQPSSIIQYGIITSQNALQAVLHHSNNVKWLVVGNKTAKEVAKRGGQVMACAKDVQALLQIILREIPNSAYTTYYRGKDIAEDIVSVLQNKGYVNVTQQIVYQAKAISQLDPNLCKELQAKKSLYIVFYSAHTAKVFCQLAAGFDLSNCTAICISDRVAQALSVIAWKAVIVAQDKNEVGMLEALDAA